MHLVRKLVLIASILSLPLPALAEDCGWSRLTEDEQTTLKAGQPIMRSEFNADGIHFQIDQWSFSGNPSLTETVATFFDLSAYKGVGGVADIELFEGEVAGNNPVLYVATPKPGNPFGDLYQPFTFSSTLRKIGDRYSVQVNYLTSPKLINHVFNDICFVGLEDKVLVGFRSSVESNPELPIDDPRFNKDVRKMLWKNVFLSDIHRASNPATLESLEVLRKALQKNP